VKAGDEIVFEEINGTTATTRYMRVKEIRPAETLPPPWTLPPPPISRTRFLFAQRDPRWANERLGNGTATIGSDGCVVCSIASMVGMPPPVVNEKLRAAGQFNGSMLSVKGTDYARVFGGQIRHVEQSPLFTREMPGGDLDRLRRHLASGQPAIVMVDSQRQAGLQTHFMLADGWSDTSNAPMVLDSWYVERVPVTYRYGPTSGKALYRFDLFEVKDG
jgi:hypothetical protein